MLFAVEDHHEGIARKRVVDDGFFARYLEGIRFCQFIVVDPQCDGFWRKDLCACIVGETGE